MTMLPMSSALLAQGVSNINSPISGQLSNPPGQNLNDTQRNMTTVIEDICPGVAGLQALTPGSGLKARCDGLVGAQVFGRDTSNYPGSVQQASPEQIMAQGAQTTRTSVNMQFNNIVGRLSALRYGARGFSLAGNNLYGIGGAAGADDRNPIWNRLSVYVNAQYSFGGANTSFRQIGFDTSTGGVIAGADYRFSDRFILGLAYNYLASNADFSRNGGKLDTNTYNGSIYGTYNITDKFYLDGIASYGASSYDSIRNIRYSLATDPNVNTQAFAKPGSDQYAFSLGGGFNHSLQGFTINPYVRANYLNLHVNGFQENERSPNGTNGWALRYDKQNIESLASIIGTQMSFAHSTSWGVLTPYIRGEYYHEFLDNSRNIGASFVGDPNQLRFNLVTDRPDRNYFIFGAGVSGTLARGTTAFFNYDTLLGRNNIHNHAFMVGLRMEL
jgi:outer membrane lipase/esterase